MGTAPGLSILSCNPANTNLESCVQIETADTEATYNGQTCTPNQDEREREDKPDLCRDILLLLRILSKGSTTLEKLITYVSTGIEALCTVASV